MSTSLTNQGSDDMVSNMKTTIDIAEPILMQAKRLAAERETTLKAVVESALREVIRAEQESRTPFRLRKCPVDGNGLQPGLSWGDWNALRALAYEGRGG